MTPERSADADVRRLAQRARQRYRYVRWQWRVAAAAIDLLGWLVCGWPAQVWRWLWSMGPTAGAAKPVERILLVQFDHLGDALLTSAMLPWLQRRYPKAAIDVLAAAWNREVFAALPQVGQVFVAGVNRFERGPKRPSIARSLLSAVCWGLWLRRRHYDLAIDARGEPTHALAMWACGAMRRVGFASGGGGFLLTDRLAYVPGRHELASRRAVLSAVDAAPQGTLAPFFPLSLPSRASLRQTLDALHGNRQGPVVAVHLGAGTPAKRWAAASWQRLVNSLAADCDASVVLLGQSSETPLARAMAHRDAVYDWTGRFDVPELAAALAAADLFVGCDSGPAHLAAAVGTAAVVLFSGTNLPQQWRPAGDAIRVIQHQVECSPCHREECPRSGHDCMAGISPERVLHGVMATWHAAGRRVAVVHTGRAGTTLCGKSP